MTIRLSRHFFEQLRSRCGINPTKREISELVEATAAAVSAYPPPLKRLPQRILELNVTMRGVRFIAVYLEIPQLLVTAYVPGYSKHAAQKARREASKAFSANPFAVRRMRAQI